MNARYSLLDHNAACARWIRKTWMQLQLQEETDAVVAKPTDSVM